MVLLTLNTVSKPVRVFGESASGSVVADEVDRATAIDIDKVDFEKRVDQLGHFGQLVGPRAADLNAENVFRHVTVRQRPL